MRQYLVMGLFLLISSGATAALKVGSVVVYSDGRVEKLLDRTDNGLLWEDDRKRQLLRSTNPVVPLLEKRAFLGGSSYRQSLSQDDLSSISRLEVGKPVRFSVNRTRDDGRTSQRHWECEFLGKSRKKVLGKKRALERYSCTRFSIHRKLHNRVFKEKRDFSYSPKLGLVVDMKRETRKKRSRSKITAILSPKKASYKNISRAVRKVRGGK